MAPRVAVKGFVPGRGKIADGDRDYFLERRYPSFGNLVPRDVASRNAKMVCDEGRGVGATGLAVFLDLPMPSNVTVENNRSQVWQPVRHVSADTGDNPYEMPMMIFPAVHYTMGGLWVDYNLMTSVQVYMPWVKQIFPTTEPNRLGASALMQGLADGYFVIPYTHRRLPGGLPWEKSVPTGLNSRRQSTW